MRMTTWRKEILQKMLENEDKDINNYVTTLTEEELDIVFDSGYGGVEGLPFTLWTTWHVYFPVGYNGAEFVGYVPRNPNCVATSHWGG